MSELWERLRNMVAGTAAAPFLTEEFLAPHIEEMRRSRRRWRADCELQEAVMAVEGVKPIPLLAKAMERLVSGVADEPIYLTIAIKEMGLEVADILVSKCVVQPDFPDAWSGFIALTASVMYEDTVREVLGSRLDSFTDHGMMVSRLRDHPQVPASFITLFEAYLRQKSFI